MSRCFRFPPPGYEKKDTLADTDLLTKEKRKEKKHKKDKKDKKDKESKERKKDKEGGERKHKDKKDRKEKHKEKKDRDKEKKRTLGAEDGLGQSEVLKGETSGSNGLQNGETSDSKFVLELGKRIRDDDGARENGVVKNCVDRRRTDLPGSSLEDSIRNPAQGSDKKSKREDTRTVNGRNPKIDHGVAENARHGHVGEGSQKTMQDETLWKANVDKQKDTEPRHALKDTDGPKDRESEKKTKSMHKEITKEKEKEEMKGKEPNKEQTMFRGSCKIYKNGQSSMLPDHPKEVNKSSTNGGILGKRKEHEMNGFLHDHGASPMKMPKPTSSSQFVGNGRKLETCQIPPVQGAVEKHLASNRKLEDKVSSNGQVPQNGRKVGSDCGPGDRASEGLRAESNRTITKDAKFNGQADMHQHNVSSGKPPLAAVQGKEKTEALPKVNGSLSGQQLKSQSSKPPPVPVLKDKVEVSKKIEKFNGVPEAQRSNSFSSKSSSVSVQVKHGVVSSAESGLKMSKEEKVNGCEKAKPLHACSSKPPVHPEPSKAKVVVSQKLPHRDLRYLNQILSVPVVADWSEFDDQEWLFCSGSNLSARKAEVGTLRCDETQNVWAEAFRIDSADVIALPYVIPF